MQQTGDKSTGKAREVETHEQVYDLRQEQGQMTQCNRTEAECGYHNFLSLQ